MGQTVATMRSMAMVVILAMVAGAATGASADMTGTLHRGAAAQAAPAVTLPTEATMTTTTTSLAAALPTTGGRRGLRGGGSPAMAMADSPAAMATTQVTAMATATTTTGAVVSETVSVLPTSSA